MLYLLVFGSGTSSYNIHMIPSVSPMSELLSKAQTTKGINSLFALSLECVQKFTVL
jgi:hypothetical protein